MDVAAIIRAIADGGWPAVAIAAVLLAFYALWTYNRYRDERDKRQELERAADGWEYLGPALVKLLRSKDAAPDSRPKLKPRNGGPTSHTERVRALNAAEAQAVLAIERETGRPRAELYPERSSKVLGVDVPPVSTKK